MSSPGFPGTGPGGSFSGRSMAAPPPNITINNPTTAQHNHHHNLHPSHPLYRTQQQLPAIFLDPASHIPQRQTPTFIGKRTLAEFQTHQNHNYNLNHNLNLLNNNNSNNLNNNQNQFLSNFLLRSVKPRTMQYNSPMSALSSMDFTELPSQRFSTPLLHQLRPNPVNLPNTQTPLPISNSIHQNINDFPRPNQNSVFQVQNLNRVVNPPEPEKKIIDHRLQELEKQLLEDNDDEEDDVVSVITNSEWSDTIQNMINPVLDPAQAQNLTQKPISSSPTSSTTSSNSSSLSVPSPASSCSKQSLMEAASAISEGKLEDASEILIRLAQASNPNGNSDQRFTDCMVSALKSRMNPVQNPPPVVEIFSKEHAESTQLLFEHSLCFKFAFMAANHAILEAAFDDKTENNVKFCVLDFDVGNGKQYANLLHALSARLNGKPATVRIAAAASDNGGDERLRAVGEMLSRQAERLGILFDFKVVTHKLAELTRGSLGCDPDELLAVNFAFRLYKMPDESVSTENPRDELLRRVKSLAPRIVTLVEQEMNTNTAPFAARVAESCSYYSALFDSIESTLARDSSERVKVEEGLSRKISNSVACEGRDRVERCEVFGKWRARMGMAGFKLKPVTPNVAESIKVRLGPGNRVTVKEENGGICFGWLGRTLTVASAWR